MNLILRKRIIQLIAMSYAMKFEDVWKVYEKIENLEIILNSLETNKLQEILREIS